MSIGSMSFTQEDFEFLKQMEGEFVAEVVFLDGGHGSFNAESLSGAIIVNKFIYNFRFLQSEFESNSFKERLAHIQGRGFIGFNPVLNHFEGFWIDNHSKEMRFDKGERLENRLDMFGLINLSDDASINKRTSHTVIDNDFYKLDFYREDGSGKEMHILGLNFKRQP